MQPQQMDHEIQMMRYDSEMLCLTVSVGHFGKSPAAAVGPKYAVDVAGVDAFSLLDVAASAASSTGAQSCNLGWYKLFQTYNVWHQIFPESTRLPHLGEEPMVAVAAVGFDSAVVAVVVVVVAAAAAAAAAAVVDGVDAAPAFAVGARLRALEAVFVGAARASLAAAAAAVAAVADDIDVLAAAGSAAAAELESWSQTALHAASELGV